MMNRIPFLNVLGKKFNSYACAEFHHVNRSTSPPCKKLNCFQNGCRCRLSEPHPPNSLIPGRDRQYAAYASLHRAASDQVRMQ